MYAIKQIKICAEYRDMLPRPWLDLSGTPGHRPIGLSPGSWQTSLGLGSMSRYSAQILICITQYSCPIYSSWASWLHVDIYHIVVWLSTHVPFIAPELPDSMLISVTLLSDSVLVSHFQLLSFLTPCCLLVCPPRTVALKWSQYNQVGTPSTFYSSRHSHDKQKYMHII